MFKYYLSEEAFHHVGVEALQANLMELNKAMVEYTSPVDDYFFSSEFWNVHVTKDTPVSQCIYALPNQQFCRVVLPNVLSRLHAVGRITDYAGLCATFPDTFPAFWGAVFNPKQDYDLTTKAEITDFRFKTAWTNVDSKTLKSMKGILFKKIVLCESAYQYLSGYSSAEFAQIINRLLELDRFNQTWLDGSFSPAKVTLNSNLLVTFESDSTNKNTKLSSHRWFKLPDGTSRYFEPHIKMGNFRIHFYPDVDTHIIYVGYIGPHLPT